MLTLFALTGPCAVQLGAPTSARFTAFSEFILMQQQRIITTLEGEEGGQACFVQDSWEKRAPAFSGSAVEGYGVTAVLQRGGLLEKGAVSTTIVTGTLTEERAKAITSRGGGHPDITPGRPYAAAALSLVLHSKSPMVPTFRSDVRYFEVSGGAGGTDTDAAAAWFGGASLNNPPARCLSLLLSLPSLSPSLPFTHGPLRRQIFSPPPHTHTHTGGADLTPYYLIDEDARAFHGHYRALCHAHDTPGGGLYPRLKVRPRRPCVPGAAAGLARVLASYRKPTRPYLAHSHTHTPSPGPPVTAHTA